MVSTCPKIGHFELQSSDTGISGEYRQNATSLQGRIQFAIHMQVGLCPHVKLTIVAISVLLI